MCGGCTTGAAVYRTGDGGASWERQNRGLPAHAWTTTLRQAMVHDGRDALGLAFGTTCGEVYVSDDLGDTWREATRGLPRVWNVTAGRLT